MAIGTKIERIDDRLDAVEAALIAALPSRAVKRSLLPYQQHTDDEIERGVVMLVGAGERDYKRSPGMTAREGVTRFLLVGHLKVDEDTEPRAIETEELDLMEELKSFLRQGVAGLTLYLDEVQTSRQLEHPYGWVVAFAEAAPPNHTLA